MVSEREAEPGPVQSGWCGVLVVGTAMHQRVTSAAESNQVLLGIKPHSRLFRWNPVHEALSALHAERPAIVRQAGI